MSGIIAEKRLSLTELAQQEDVNTSTVWRWGLKGVRGVLLETFCVGGRRYTSKEAFIRFIELTTNAAKHKTTTPSDSAQRQEQITHTEAELDQAGL